MSEQQVLNYLLWMKERGQHFLIPNAPPLAPEPAPAALAPPIVQVKVLFLSLTPLADAEHEMVTRIGTALSLRLDDFAIVSGDKARADLGDQPQAHVVVMGDDAKYLIDGTPNIALMIPHPRAMLREPNLKVSAWTTLQKLKSTL
ncbi:MAG: hypothetical protein H7249_10565 [Chitinophagaceae bacterium]|nr:hypothetical protein [Oligoflexus sp.]